MIIKYFSPSMAPNTKEDDVQTGSWLCSEESGTDEEMDSKKKQRFGFGILKKSHEGSREGELLCDKAVPAANQALSHQNTCTYMMTGTVSRRVIYTLTLHPAESFALSVTGAWISWCACGWTLLLFFFLHWSLMSWVPQCHLIKTWWSCFIPILYADWLTGLNYVTGPLSLSLVETRCHGVP